MKTQSLLFALFFNLLFIGNTIAQERTKNVTPSTKKTQSRIAALLNSKTFEFVANTVFPTSGSPKNLVGSSYSVTFSPEMIISNLPFYGRGYSGINMSRDKGMRFKGKPESFIIEKDKEYQVTAIIKGENDTYSLSISVSDSGYASLSISSNHRETIRYQGEIK